MESMNMNYARGGEVLLGAAMLLMVVLGLTGCDAQGQAAVQAPAPKVDVAEVQPTPVTLWNDYTGHVAAPQTVALRPRVSGYIDKVAFKEGDIVNKGEVLFEIDPRQYQARARAARAGLAQAESALKLASSEAGRAQRLLKSHAISREEYDQRHSAKASAQARVDEARAALESARLELSYTQVRSPITGRTGRAMITRGNLASADQTVLTTVVSTDPMYVYFDVSSASMPDPALLAGKEMAGKEMGGEKRDGASGDGLAVRVGVAGEQGLPHRGRVDFIDNRLDAGTGTLEYRAVLANPDGRLRPGQFARVSMPVSHRSGALLVNRKAVLTDQDRRYVYVVNDKGVVSRREVTPGRNVGEETVVRAGLKSGDRVIVNGLQRIFKAGVIVSPQLVQMNPPQPVPELASAP